MMTKEQRSEYNKSYNEKLRAKRRERAAAGYVAPEQPQRCCNMCGKHKLPAEFGAYRGAPNLSCLVCTLMRKKSKDKAKAIIAAAAKPDLRNHTANAFNWRVFVQPTEEMST